MMYLLQGKTHHPAKGKNSYPIETNLRSNSEVFLFA